MMLQCVEFTDKPVVMNSAEGEAYLKRNFDLCRAVNLLSLSVVLDQMVAAGMPREQAECFEASAKALLQLMRTENNRLRIVLLQSQQGSEEP